MLTVYNNHYKHQSYVIGSIYRRPSDLIADLTQFTDEFSAVLGNVHATPNQANMNVTIILIYYSCTPTINRMHFMKMLHLNVSSRK